MRLLACTRISVGASRMTLLARCYSSYPTEKPPSTPKARRKTTINSLMKLKSQGIPITALTAHDYPSAKFIESTNQSAESKGIDICLVGDSLAMVACGYESTTQLGLEEMLYHCRSVARGCHTSMLIADLPFGENITLERGVNSSVKLIQDGHMDAVKIEGGREIVPLVKQLSQHGIPVMAHIGLTPQRHVALSGFTVQGKTATSAADLYETAHILQEAGAFSVVLEAVPSKVAGKITTDLLIPTIGIGAGSQCDGQILVQLDMLGVNSLAKAPKFLRQYADFNSIATDAINAYANAVSSRAFPEEGKHTYKMATEEIDTFLSQIKDQK